MPDFKVVILLYSNQLHRNSILLSSLRPLPKIPLQTERKVFVKKVKLLYPIIFKTFELGLTIKRLIY